MANRRSPDPRRRPTPAPSRSGRTRVSTPVPPQPRSRFRFLRWSLRLIIYGTLFLAAVWAGLVSSAYSSVDDLEAKADFRQVPGTVYARDGKTVLRVLRAPETRRYLEAEQLPDVLVHAVIAAEDRRFFEHPGVDVRGLARAALVDIRARAAKEGGSTITQQLVKNAYVGPDRSIGRKTREAVLAVALESRWSKEHILAAYLNTAYFGSGHYGVVDAASGYYGVPVDKLTYPQAALLAALLRAPEGNNPSVSPENARLARNRTLDAMLELGTISTAAHGFARATALPSTAAPIRPRTGSREIAPQFADTIVGDIVAKYGVRTALGGGLTVRTTLDARLQRAANKAAQQAADVGLDAAVVTIDVASGELRAMAHGGDAARLAFNVALDGQRQPGSAFKPFMLAAAYEQGLAPGTSVVSAPYDRTVDGVRFQVSNGGGYTGMTTLERATWQSDNTVYARLQERFGIMSAIDVAHAAGIRSEIDPVPAAVLGALPRGTTPTELAHAYATFAAHGERVSLVGTGGPRRIARVTDSNGETWRPTAVRVEAMPAGVADLVTETLQGVVTRGTGTAAAIGRPVAGKTGTTEDYRDAWFVGYTPGLVTAVWVGHAEGGIPMKSQNGGGAVTGGSIPARIWSTYMRAALDGQPIQQFDLDAPKFVSVIIDPATGLLAGEWCAERVRSSVIAGQQPTEPSTDCEPRTRPAPDLTGLSVDDARALLVEQQFLEDGPVLDELVTDAEQEGLVLRQEPAPGAPVAREQRISLVVGDDPFTD